MSFSGSKNHFVLTEEETWFTGLKTVVPPKWSVYAFDQILIRSSILTSEIKWYLGEDPADLSESDERRLQDASRELKIVNNLGSIFVQLAGPQIVDNFLRTL
jgi:hypothetical protein